MHFWARQLFASSTEACQYLVFFTVCTAGMLEATCLWIIDGSMLLLLLGWPQFRPFFERAAALNAEISKAARQDRAHDAGPATMLAVPVCVKLGADALLLAGVYLFGGLIRWTWLAEVNQATLLNFAD